MTAITQRLLHHRPTPRTHTFSLHRFSTSSDSGSTSDAPPPKSGPESESESQPKPSVSSYLQSVRASLQREPLPHNRLQPPRKPLFTPPPQTPPPSGAAPKLDEIRRKLTGFRSQYASSPHPSSAASGPSVSLQDLYQRNLPPKNDDSAAPSNSTGKTNMSPSLDAIRNSINQLRTDSPSGKASDPLSLTRWKETLNLKQPNNASGDGGNRMRTGLGLPSYINNGKNTIGGGGGILRTGSLKMYDYSELGSKLKELRPEGKKGKWFSLIELNERLAKLRQIEEEKKQQSQLGMGGQLLDDLRDSIYNLSVSTDEKEKKRLKQKYNILSQLGGTPTFMMSPPKDHLVEKYFHPDNLSSADKLKLELKKVRDEFKMSESDCGSARVQVAQLTTKIKHLSTVLQKKDKHSRRGLQLMVQRRKKLLKYLRRTDWDSYSLVLSKLGLRDNPDIKA
ncbi:hypothetical protein ABFS83_09G083200 [Erythranthe nasuta]